MASSITALASTVFTLSFKSIRRRREISVDSVADVFTCIPGDGDGYGDRDGMVMVMAELEIMEGYQGERRW